MRDGNSKSKVFFFFFFMISLVFGCEIYVTKLETVLMIC